MDNQNIEIGKRIRSLREKYKLSREALAGRSEISVQFLYDIETGKKSMTVTTLSKICTALNASADEIIFGSPKNSIVLSGEQLKKLSEDKIRSLKDIIDLVIGIAK